MEQTGVHPLSVIPTAPRSRWKHLRFKLVERALRGRPQWARVVMDRETLAIVNRLNPASLRVLEISGTKWADFGFKSYGSVHWPSFNICAQTRDAQYDLIIAEQVFEHLLYPYRAGRNVYAMLAPGGHFLNTTPFMVRIHDEPIDCSRWTPLGMRYFLEECGFALENIHAAGWGNKGCVIGNLRVWLPYWGWQSLRNDVETPVVVWALAKK